MSQESRILSIKIPYWERIKILLDPMLEGKRESRNESQDFKRRQAGAELCQAQVKLGLGKTSIMSQN